MTDNEVKTPNKRKSLSAATPGKKAKFENGTPGKKSPNKPAGNKVQTPKAQTPKPQTPKPQTPKPQQNKQQKSPKKQPIKAFEGTKNLAGNKKKPEKKERVQNPKKDGEGKKGKTHFQQISALIASGDEDKKKEAIEKINIKIESIQSRGDKLSKTATRKLNWLILKRNVALGKPPKEGLVKIPVEKKEKKAGAKGPVAKPGAKKAGPIVKPVADEDDSAEEEEEEDAEQVEANAEDSDDSGDEVEGDDDDDDEVEGEEDDDDDDDDEEDDSEEEAMPVIRKKENSKKKQTESVTNEPQTINKKKVSKDVTLDDLKTKEIIAKGQKRFVLFIGNIPYDATKQDLLNHFCKAGEIVDVRIPLEMATHRPRGFAYLEVKDEETYQKCLSMHHTFMNKRQINVMYTQGGKKKGDEKKNQIKVKNFKLHAMRKNGQLAGSIRQNQKRSFRRTKNKNESNKSDQNEDNA